MTDTQVKGINPLVNYVSAKPSGSGTDSLAGSFTDAFSKASGQTGVESVFQRDNTVKGSQVKVSHTDKRGLEQDAPPKADKSQCSELNKEAETAINESGEDLVEKVAEELGVSEEEVIKAMETLGLTMVDLLNADNMTQLVLAVTGEDMLSLMTDEGLYNSLQNLLGMVNETVNALQEELGLTPEDLAAIVEQVKSTKNEQTAGTNQNVTAEEELQESQKGQKDYTVTVERDGEVVEVSVKVDGNSKEESLEVTSQKIQMPEQSTEGKSSKEESSSQGHETQTNILLDNLLNKQQPVAKAEAVFNNVMEGQTTSTQDIMNQIMDYMKIQVKADFTQMELQLNPANLGKVNINISSKEGVITAQFLAQNEVVKAAIESQIVQLKNNFEEQGIKVEAVEVTIESHEFERNLGGQQSNGGHEGESKKRGIRKLNLNEFDPEETELDEAEQIAVEMMAVDGNTVDYTA